MEPGQAARLRIYIRHDDVDGNRPLADGLIYRAQELGLAGAIALRGMIGFGRSGGPHPTELILSQNLPVIVEIVDSRERIDGYLAAIGPMLRGALVTVEPIEVLRYDAATNAQA